MRSLAGVVLLCGCAGELERGLPASDFEPVPDDAKADGAPARFDRNTIVSDAVFREPSFDAATLQAFFERTPYGTRSWLADASVGDVPAAVAIVEAASARDLNPLMLVVRLQVEGSFVSGERDPGARADYALGCGCAGGCAGAVVGLEGQLACGAETLRGWYDASVDGSGTWRAGAPAHSLDGLRVTPATHATASLYAYTPWVLTDRGGNWLVWNVTRRYLAFLQAQATPE